MSTQRQTKSKKTEQIIGLVSEFCTSKLNEEYTQLCTMLAMTLDDLPQTPMLRGREEIWAAAIIYTVGGLNFLGDKTFEPYLPSSAISDYFGTSGSTVSAKSRMIMDLLDLHRLDNRFATQRMKEWNPFNNLIMVDDMIVPLDSLPDEIQKLVKEARERGEDVVLRTK